MDKKKEEDLQKIEWLLEKEDSQKKKDKQSYIPFYGDVTELNTERTILDLVGKDTLEMLCTDTMDLLDTSVAVYEKNGDYAYGLFCSGWCQLMDAASRKLCNTNDNKVALSCGKWLCHENCWHDSAKQAIKIGKPTDIDCIGGIKLYAEPIYANNQVIGTINIGYGNPPTDEKTLKELSQKYRIDYNTLLARAREYKPRPPFIIDIAKKRLHNITLLIGKIVESAQKGKQLIESGEKYQTVFENTGTATILVKEDKTISLVNNQFEKLSGYSKEEIENKMKWSDLVVLEDLEKMEKYHQSRRQNREAPPNEYEFRGRDKRGNIKSIFMKIDLIPGTSQSIASMMDITKTKETKKKLLYRIEIERIITSISTKFVGISPEYLDSEINRLLREIGEFTHIDRSYIFLFSENDNLISNTHEWCAQGIKPQIHNLQKLSSSIFPWWMEKLTKNEVIHVPDVGKLPLQANTEKETLQAQDVQSVLVVPISNSTKLVGFIGFDAVHSKKYWGKEDIALLRTLGDIINGALERLESEKKLKKTLEATIRTMSKMIDARDPYTSGHQERVTKLATRIASDLKLSKDQRRAIRIAALIHDIGKIGIPSEILTKPTKLSNIEFSLIKNHSQMGYDILKGIDFAYPIAKIILQHHERINGSGYPNHLQRKEIILEAKIIAVADVVEAMSSHRPYRAALGIDVALEEITKNKGILYEPEVVDVCIKLFREKGFKFE